jgi:hypothetical protein
MLPATEDNRRNAYRVQPASIDHLDIALVRNHKRLVPDEIGDVTLQGASLRFGKEKASELKKGDEVMVLIMSPDLDGGADVRAQVVFTGDSPNGRLIGLSFDQTEELLNRGQRQFFQLFNRRIAYRGVQPESTSELTTAVMPIKTAHAADTRHSVSVRNISTTGICVGIDTAGDAFMRERKNIRVCLKLPDQDQECVIAARVCYRSEIASAIYYGCHFEWNDTDDAMDTIEELTAYTLDRFENEFQFAHH